LFGFIGLFGFNGLLGFIRLLIFDRLLGLIGLLGLNGLLGLIGLLGFIGLFRFRRFDELPPREDCPSRNKARMTLNRMVTAISKTMIPTAATISFDIVPSESAGCSRNDSQNDTSRVRIRLRIWFRSVGACLFTSLNTTSRQVVRLIRAVWNFRGL
jgi:hypothetical protein